jgi:hypothetical protein
MRLGVPHQNKFLLFRQFLQEQTKSKLSLASIFTPRRCIGNVEVRLKLTTWRRDQHKNGPPFSLELTSFEIGWHVERFNFVTEKELP